MWRSSISVSLGFHPLKAGRRPEMVNAINMSYFGFHPLKAGRRHGYKTLPNSSPTVSIPSRRVGDVIPVPKEEVRR